MHGRLPAALPGGNLIGTGGDHLIDVHVALRAGAGLPCGEGELAIRSPAGNGTRGLDDELRLDPARVARVDDAFQRCRNENIAGDFESRRAILSQFDATRRAFDRSKTVEAMNRFDQMAYDLVTGERARNAFDLSSEKPRPRKRSSSQKGATPAMTSAFTT